MKVVVAAFKALVGVLFVIVKTGCETDGALHSSSKYRDSEIEAIILQR